VNPENTAAKGTKGREDVPAPRRALGTICLILLAGCAPGDASERWQGTIETLPNGAVRVTNPAAGVWTDEDRWRIVPVLTLGDIEGDGPDVFSSIADLEVGEDGRIYVLDRQVNELRIFDATGAHQRTVGRAGNGPGEFERANGLQWLPGDSLLVIDGDGGRYSVFDADGTFARTMIRPMTSYGWVYQGEFTDGVLYESGLRRTGEEYEQALIGMRLGAEAELLDTLSFPRPPGEPIGSYSLETASFGMNMGIPFAPDPSWQLMDDGTLWWGFGGEYRILHLSPAGDTLREILSGAGAIAVTSEEIEEWAAGESPRRFVEAGGNLDLGRIPKQKPYFTDLYVDPAGRLWVDVPTVDGLTSFDVFDAEGRLLGRVDTGVQRDAYVDPIVRDDLLYMVTSDELDVQNVSVFRILMAVRPAGDPG
jgi:hypothetical protein